MSTPKTAGQAAYEAMRDELRKQRLVPLPPPWELSHIKSAWEAAAQAAVAFVAGRDADTGPEATR